MSGIFLFTGLLMVVHLSVCGYDALVFAAATDAHDEAVQITARMPAAIRLIGRMSGKMTTGIAASSNYRAGHVEFLRSLSPWECSLRRSRGTSSGPSD